MSCCYLKQSQITMCYWNSIYCPHAVDSHHCPQGQLLTYRILGYEPAEDPTRIFSSCAASNICKEQVDVNKVYLDWAAISQDNNTNYISNAWQWMHHAQKCLERKMLMIERYSVCNLAAWALYPQQGQTAHQSSQPLNFSSPSGNLASVFSDHGLGFTFDFVPMCLSRKLEIISWMPSNDGTEEVLMF